MKFIIILLFVIYTSTITSAAHDPSDLKEKRIVFDQPTHPNGVIIDPEAELGNDIKIACGVHILGKSRIGNGCNIGPFTMIKNCIIGDYVKVLSHCVLENSTIEAQAEVGPFAHISEKSEIKEGAVIGNFVEVKRSSIGKKSKAKHLSYLGDTRMGESVNVGAGTITCNYDGVSKHNTIIGDHALIGSNNSIVAPVTIGKGAMTAAGSTITENVPDNGFAIARSQQTNKPGYASKLLAKFRALKEKN